MIDVSDNKSVPDVKLSGTNSSINVELYFTGGLPRPVVIEVTNKNGPVKLRVPGELTKRNYHITLKNTNGECVGVQVPPPLRQSPPRVDPHDSLFADSRAELVLNTRLAGSRLTRFQLGGVAQLLRRLSRRKQQERQQQRQPHHTEQRCPCAP